MNVIVPVASLVPPDRVAVSWRAKVPSAPRRNGPPALVVNVVGRGLTTGFSFGAPQSVIVLAFLLVSPLA